MCPLGWGDSGCKSGMLVEELEGVILITIVERVEEVRENESPLARPPILEDDVLPVNEDIDLDLGSCGLRLPSKLVTLLARRRRASLFQVPNTLVHAETLCSSDAGHSSSTVTLVVFVSTPPNE